MSETGYTAGRWYVGAQNDALYIIDQKPSMNNDYPNHDAKTEPLAKVIMVNGALPTANANLMASATELYEALKNLLSRVALDADSKHWFPSEQQAARKALSKARGES